MSIAGTAYTAAEVEYLHDDAYQLTGEVRTGGNAYSQYFEYDPAGNRTRSTLGGVETTYLCNAADQLTSETSGNVTTTYLYDANGALTKSDDGTTVKAYTYDYDGYQIAFDTTGTENDATYTYDADKRRVAKSVNSVTTKFFLDGRNVIADYDGSNNLVATYVTPGLDANLSQTRGGSTYYYMKDGLGSARNLLDGSEAVQNTYDYYAFGKELGDWTESVSNRYTYTAREWDQEAQQYYYRARCCSGNGRFGSRDPLVGNEFGSQYSYVRQNPVSSVDPTGLICNVFLGRGDANIPDEQDKEWRFGHEWLEWDGGKPGFWSANKTITGPGIIIDPDPYPSKSPELIRVQWATVKDIYSVPPFTNKLQEGPAKGTSCCKATCSEINGCLDAFVTRSKATPPRYNFGSYNCRHWAREALDRCCLKKK